MVSMTDGIRKFLWVKTSCLLGASGAKVNVIARRFRRHVSTFTVRNIRAV